MQRIATQEPVGVKSVVCSTAPVGSEVITLVEYEDGAYGIRRNREPVGTTRPFSRLDECIEAFVSLCDSRGLK